MVLRSFTANERELRMTHKVVPMIHVPDVRATAVWYESIGFRLDGSHEDDGEMSWALLSFGESEIMLNEGGAPSAAHRREVDLYVHVDDVDALYARLAGRVEIVHELYDAIYGMREFIIRDLNRFWITFGQPRSDQA
ncbi:MAG TPA: VOC family protein [Thermoanaerobaculia bacterium]|nr:VOC family protein [Thermoanaerobaculia bacterium]